MLPVLFKVQFYTKTLAKGTKVISIRTFKRKFCYFFPPLQLFGTVAKYGCSK